MDARRYLVTVIEEFRKLKDLADRALAQVGEGDRTATLDGESNSIAVLVKHVGGNLRSRWTDFLTTDGEKPDRRRDAEFVLDPDDSWEDLRARWEAGWRRLFETLDTLSGDDLNRTVRIRGEAHSVVEAVNRQLTHQAYHVGQIVLLAKHFAGSRWSALSIPRGQSEAFNAAMRARGKPR